MERFDSSALGSFPLSTELVEHRMDNDESPASAVRKVSKKQKLEGKEYAASKLAEVAGHPRQRLEALTRQLHNVRLHCRRLSARYRNHNCSLIIASTSRRFHRWFIDGSELHTSQSYAHTVNHTVPYDAYAYDRMIFFW
jgi:hypothetical protein